MISKDLLVCAAARNKRTCDNRLNIRWDTLEVSVLNGLPIEQQRVRVSAPGFEVVWLNEGESRFTASLHAEARVPLDDIKFGSENTRFLGGTLEADGIRKGADWPKVREIVATLRGLQPRADASLTVSLADIGRSMRDLYLMHQVTSPSEMCLEFEPFPDQTYDFEKMPYYATANAGELAAYTLVEREVLRWAKAPEGRRNVEFGVPIIRESWLVTNAGEQQRRLMDGDYDHHLAQMQKASKIVGLRDIAAFVRAFQKTEAPETSVRPSAVERPQHLRSVCAPCRVQFTRPRFAGRRVRPFGFVALTVHESAIRKRFRLVREWGCQRSGRCSNLRLT